ncbi:hypothetical protein KCU89_g2798, partial [Aureobasidium melanogenum]
MMRQRGAGARSIPTNFGFIFHAGPIQVDNTTAIESPSHPNTQPIAIAHTQPHHRPESSLPANVPAPKRKRVVSEEEDDQVWFKKRTKKTTIQEQQGHAILTATLDSGPGLEVTQEEPPTDKKPAKRKVVRKRVLVPRSRQKESLKPQPDQPIPLPEPVAADLPPPNKKSTKTLAVSEQISRQLDTLEAPLLEHGDQDKLSNHSIHTVSVTKSVPHKNTKSSHDPQGVYIVEKSREKTVPRKRVSRKHVQESIETVQPSLEESTQTTTTKVPLEEEDVDKKLKTETARQKRVAKKHPGKAVEQQTAEVTVDAQPNSTHETDPVPKKKKMVRRVRVPRTTTKRATSEQDDSVNMVNKHDTKPSVSTDDIDSALLEAVAPAPVAKKPSKAPKRIFFDDDSDIDLDQMLSGIAAIAGTKGDTRTSTSRSSRVTTRKTAA